MSASTEKQSEPVRLVRHRARRDDDEVGDLAVRDVRLRAVDHPVIAAIFARVFMPARSLPAPGSVIAIARMQSPGNTARQKALLLLFVAELAEIRTDEPRVQRVEEADVAVAQVLFDHHLLVAKVADAGAAVLLVGPHQQIAVLAALANASRSTKPCSRQRCVCGPISFCTKRR
jgi:hypothetical protein